MPAPAEVMSDKFAAVATCVGWPWAQPVLLKARSRHQDFDLTQR